MSFDTAYTKRGNVTGIQTFSIISPPVSTTRLSKFDIFGNVVEADVSCCQVKTFAFSLNTTWYSRPDTVTNGRIGVTPFLTTAYSYDFNTGLVTQMTDPDNGITGYQYDAAWRLLTVSTPTGAQITTTPDRTNGNDQLSYAESVTYPEGLSSKTLTTRRWFDGAGRVLRQGAGAGGSPTTYDAVAAEFDALGRVSRMSNPYLGNASGIGTPTAWTSNEYDNLSRVKKVTLPDQQTVQTDYNGSETTVTDQVGRKKRSVADGLGRLVSVTEQDTATGSLTVTTSYTYDAVDNLLEINQGGQIRSFIYDPLSRVKSETTPEGGTVTFTYTDFDAMLKRTHAARGVETHYGYDSLNRPNKVWYTGLGGNDSGTIRPALPASVAATSDVDVTYRSSAPGNGQPLSVSDGQIAGFSSSESYVYESLTGRLQSRTRAIDGNSYQTQYQYNGMSQVTLMIYPSGKRVQMNYDSRGRMLGEDKLDTAGNVVTAYASNVSYNVAGLLTGMSLGNGVNESYGYSSDRLQLTGQTAVKGASTLMNLTYGYAAAAGDSGATTTAGNSGQLMSIGGTIASAARNQAFTYDNVARLKTANGWSAWSQSYVYDNKNNLTSITGTQAKTISVDSATNRIQSVNGGPSYSYDAAGNVTSDGVHNYQYDAAGRLAKVDAGSANEASYYYDFQNWRVKKVFGGNTTNYIWESGRVIAEYGTAPPQGSGGLKYYQQDRLSTRMITDANGTVVGTNDNLPFGESFAASGEIEKHRFTNYERDGESGTDYAVNRQHSFSIGRFMQPDPVQGSIANPRSLNRYSYTLNDPINLSDPLGLYEGCVHQAMSEYLAKLSGKFSDSVAKQLGQFAGDGPGGADSFRYAASSPWNAFLGFLGLGPAATIHFASPEQLGKEKRAFAGYITDKDYQSAGFVLHSIEDVHGAHLGFELGFGHLFAGHEPDRIIGDTKFVNVSNEVLRFLTGDSSVKLTPTQLNKLIDAIIKECGKKAGQLKITRPPASPPIIPFIGTPPDSGGFGGPFFWPRNWYWDPPPPSDGDHLA